MRRLAGWTMVGASLLCCGASAQKAETHWVASWGTSVYQPEAANLLPDDDLRDASLRQIVHLSLAGAEVRVKLSNEAGTAALRIGAVHLAKPVSTAGAAIVPGSDMTVTFDGAAEVVIPPGAAYLSDAVPMRVGALSDLAITIYYPLPPARQTGHPGSRATSYVVHGNQADATNLPGAKRVEHWYQVAEVDVAASTKAEAVVAFGDSITDGHAAITNENTRWPDEVARRFAAQGVGLVNEGIGGNHMLTDGLGPNALARMDRDVLSVAGVKTVILLEGVNDLGGLTIQHEVSDAEHAALVARIIGSYEQVIQRAHAHGVRVIGGTITPYLGSDYYHPGPKSEADRQAINAWVRAAGHFDGVVDFDKAVRDPAHPDRLNPAYDCGDHLHPSPAGYKVMGDAVEMRVISGK